MAHHLFTSESVTEGHPDKICDQISDAILDAILAQDPNGRVACECTVTTGVVNVMGEITTDCYVDIPKVVRQTVREIGYDRAKYGFDCETCAVITNIDEQSADIALGVDQSLESKETGDSALDNGAGDQGMMFGFACDETPELMPLPVSLAHKLAKRLTAVRKQGLVDYLRPDGKTQVTVEYDEQNRPVRVHTVVLSTQHAPEVDMAQLRKDMIELVIRPTIPAELLDDDTRYLRRYLRRQRPARRRRVLRQRPDEGRPQRRLRRALRGQEHRGGRACPPLPRAAGVCHRRGRARERARRHAGHGHCAGCTDRRCRAAGV